MDGSPGRALRQGRFAADFIHRLNFYRAADVGPLEQYFVIRPPSLDYYLEVLAFLNNLSDNELQNPTELVRNILAIVHEFAQSDNFANYLINPGGLAPFRPGRLLERPVRRRLVFPPMATFTNCSFYHVFVRSNDYIPRNTVTRDDNAVDLASITALRADKISRALISSERPSLKLEGSNKTRQYEDFTKMFSTIICDYHPSFKHLINLSVDQHASIDKLDAAIAASGTAAAAPRNGISGDTADTANCFKFSEAANDKLYNVLMLSTGGHAREIVMRVNDNDGRKVLFALRADALKQTEGQVQTLQSQILTTKLLANKHPAIFLDKLQRNCQELDSLLRLQDGSAFGEGQTKAAILNALPDEYKPFRISRDQHDKRGESVIALIITIVNHYIAYIEKAGGNTRQAGGATANPS